MYKAFPNSKEAEEIVVFFLLNIRSKSLCLNLCFYFYTYFIIKVDLPIYNNFIIFHRTLRQRAILFYIDILCKIVVLMIQKKRTDYAKRNQTKTKVAHRKLLHPRALGKARDHYNSGRTDFGNPGTRPRTLHYCHPLNGTSWGICPEHGRTSMLANPWGSHRARQWQQPWRLFLAWFHLSEDEEEGKEELFRRRGHWWIPGELRPASQQDYQCLGWQTALFQGRQKS